MQKSCEEKGGKPQNMPKAEEDSPRTGGRRKSSTLQRRCKPRKQKETLEEG